MTAPRLEKLRHFIHEVDRLHREHHQTAPLLDAVAGGWRRWCVTTTGCRKSTPCRIRTITSSICCMPTPGSASRLSASSGDRGKRRRSMITGCGGHWDAARRGGKPALPAGCRWHTARAGRRHASGSRPWRKSPLTMAIFIASAMRWRIASLSAFMSTAAISAR